ncbi:MAG: copper chaperone PCu(A)C [Kangiellaceae bacterium]
MNAWVREPIVESETHAGYFTLINVSDKTLELVSIQTNAYEQVEIHEMTHVNGMMKMSKIDSLILEPNGKVKLAPGGKHLMLISPNRTIKEGGRVVLKLKFKSGRVQIVDLPVKSK